MALQDLRSLMGKRENQETPSSLMTTFFNNIAFGVQERHGGAGNRGRGKSRTRHEFIMATEKRDIKPIIWRSGRQSLYRVASAKRVSHRQGYPPKTREILIFDEATSALGHRTPNGFGARKALDQTSRRTATTLVIAHRLSTIQETPT